MKILLGLLMGIFYLVSGTQDKSKDLNIIPINGFPIYGQDTMIYGPMKQYWMVFLKKGPNRNQDSASRVIIQKAHIANIERLAKEKVIIMAGPMGYSYPNDLQGIFVMDAKDSVTAAFHIKTDTAVKLGRLVFEIHPWWIAQGKYEFK